ncbi:MAG: DNA-3-methyladenine glycosylase 2 family protein, partial [Pseudomonadota bacterium]
MNRPIATDADVAAALEALIVLDPRLEKAAERAAPLPLRLLPAGMPGLLKIVCGQQLSTASAAAVWGRFEASFAPFEPAEIAAASDDDLRGVGLSRQKTKTYRAIAEAASNGLDLDNLHRAAPVEAREALEAIPGIGRWTADLFLMFCAGHPDILPTGDLAVRRG